MILQSLLCSTHGKVGGLCLLWNRDEDIKLCFANQNTITSFMFSDPTAMTWLHITIYGSPYATSKGQFWEILKATIKSFDGPWVCIGDLIEC